MEEENNKQTNNLPTTEMADSTDSITKEQKKMNLKEKFASWRKLITVEPGLLAFLCASTLATVSLYNLRFEMSCRVNHKFNDTICSDLTKFNLINVDFTRILSWFQPVPAIVSCILVLCFGSFSDRYKLRKPFFVLPPLGEMFSGIGLILCVAFITNWPVEMYFFMAWVLPALFGGSQTLLMAIYSYISDISTKEERTARIGTVEIISLIIAPVGTAFGGVLQEYIGYYGILSICVILFGYSVIYFQFYVVEKREPIKRKRNLCVDIFDIKNVITDIFKVIIRQRKNNRRILLILTYICYILMGGPATVEGHLLVTYATTTFKWTPKKFGYFNSYETAVHIFGLILAIAIFIKKLKMNDMLIAALASVFAIISRFWYAFVTSEILFWLGPIISVFSGLYIIALRSVVSKLVNDTEIATAQALFAICEALQPLIYSRMYADFYKQTGEKFPTAFLLLSALLYILPLVILLGMYFVYRKEEADEPVREEKQGIDNEGVDIEVSKL